jgi:hypothetical protein
MPAGNKQIFKKQKIDHGQKKSPSRRVSDEVFDESFCEFFIPTEDCSQRQQN